VMYAELVVVFDSSRGEAVLLQSLFMGFSSASGRFEAVKFGEKIYRSSNYHRIRYIT
jgi:hypothetical protein